MVKVSPDEFIYAFGQSVNTGSSLNDVWRGRTRNGSSIAWTRIASAPVALYTPSCTLHNNAMYVFGGRGVNGYATNTFMTYKTVWSTIENDISPRYGASLTMYVNADGEDELTLFGGVVNDEESAGLGLGMESYLLGQKCWVGVYRSRLCARPKRRVLLPPEEWRQKENDAPGVMWGVIIIMFVFVD